MNNPEAVFLTEFSGAAKTDKLYAPLLQFLKDRGVTEDLKPNLPERSFHLEGAVSLSQIPLISSAIKEYTGNTVDIFIRDEVITDEDLNPSPDQLPVPSVPVPSTPMVSDGQQE
jgi:hypothetical protein